MKIKSSLVLAIFLLYSIAATAQLPMQNSINNISNKNKPSGSPTFNLLQNAGGKFNISGESKPPGYNNSLPFSKLAANSSDSDLLLAPQAAPCNGVSVISINFHNTGREVKVSGTENTKGVVYRYLNVGVAPDGVSIDAIVTVEDYINNQDSTPNDFTSDDLPASVFGFEQNLQPSIGEANNFIAATPWNGSIRYKIQFVAAGTNTPKIISVAATTVDNDGSNACGGLKESVTYSTALNQVLVSASTNQILSGTTLTAKTTTNQAGIGADYAGAALFVNISEFQ